MPTYRYWLIILSSYPFRKIAQTNVSKLRFNTRGNVYTFLLLLVLVGRPVIPRRYIFISKV